MEHRTLGNTGMECSILGFGGSEIGWRKSSPSEAETILNSALDAGINVIDTAACYHASEELIGGAISHRRDEFHLFSKCGHGVDDDQEDWTVQTVRESIDRSLRRLKTDRIDLMQLHSCSKDVLESGELIEELEKARDAGKIRFIGYSGDRENAVWAVESGRFSTLQTSCSIADQQCIDLYLEKAKQARMGIIAKRPIANAAWMSEPDEGAYARPYWERLQELDFPFLGDYAPRAVGMALRFTLACPSITTAIVGTSNSSRFEQNSRLIEREIDPEDFQAIRQRWKDRSSADWVGQT